MAPPSTSTETLKHNLAVAREHRGIISQAARALGLPRQTLQNRLEEAVRAGLTSFKEIASWRQSTDACRPAPANDNEPEPEEPDYHQDIHNLLRKGATLAEMAERTGLPAAVCEAIVDQLKHKGINIHPAGDRLEIAKEPAPAFVHGPVFEYTSRPDNTFVFGATGDWHVGSKYHRPDVLTQLYDRFAAAGVDRVFHTGNWIDGESRFNRFDLDVHGMDAQVKALIQALPRKDGLITYAVAGDDHEGWYCQREGVDIGRYAEQQMRNAGRDDWVDLGYMEAHVKLVNANTGAQTIMSVVHPGGGSAYAISYSIQKIVESLDGGEKPAVGLYGHYHKLWAGNIRNVWCLQTGCVQDQTPFMRKKKLEAHVGGAVVEMEQDPDTGAIIAFRPDMVRYFNRGYYNNRWSMSGPVNSAERTVHGE